MNNVVKIMAAKLYIIHLVALLMGVARCDSSCAQVGQICSEDCKEVVLCTGIGKEPIPVATCKTDDNSQYCTIKNGTADCSGTEPDKCNTLPNVNVACGAYGEFPHPKECDTTIQCNSELEIEQICKCAQDHFVDITIPGLPCKSGGTCSDPLTCNSIGETVSFNDVYCYTCWRDSATGQDTMKAYFCPSKLNLKSIFFPSPKANKNCVPTSSTSSSTTTSPSSSSSSTSSTSPEPTTPPDSANCTRIDEKFPDPDCCQCYYRCNKNLQLEHRKCPQTPSASYFNKTTQSCPPGTC